MPRVALFNPSPPLVSPQTTDSDFEGFDGEHPPVSGGGTRSAADKEVALIEHRLSGQIKGATMVSLPLLFLFCGGYVCTFSGFSSGSPGRGGKDPTYVYEWFENYSMHVEKMSHVFGLQNCSFYLRGTMCGGSGLELALWTLSQK